jgi:hypothetical protein
VRRVLPNLILPLICCWIAFQPATARAQSADESEMSHPGYIDDVQEERTDPSHEVVIMPLPPLQGQSLMQQLVPDKLSKDFSKEFRNRFGTTEYEEVEYESNRFADVGENEGRLTPVNEFIALQESFGKYMLAKLADYHANEYLKNSSATRSVYDIKQKLSNVEVKDSSGYKYKMVYDIASNRLTVSMEKPKEVFHKSIDTTVGASAITTVRLGYDVDKTVLLKTEYGIQNDALTLQAKKTLTKSLGTTLTGQSFGKDQSVDVPAQNRVLLGLSWTD